MQSLRESETRLKQQYAESQRRERMLVRRLALKEQEIQDFAVNTPIFFQFYVSLKNNLISHTDSNY